MEHLFAHSAGTVFNGHRGKAFTKVIQITTNKQLSLAVKMPPNAECELTIRDRSIPVQASLWRTLKIMWLNVAVSDPGKPDEPGLEVQAVLKQAVHDQMPEVLLISSTGYALKAGQIPEIMSSIGHTVAYQNAVGLDKGVFCASFTAKGNMWQDRDEGNDIESGIMLHYNWF